MTQARNISLEQGQVISDCLLRLFSDMSRNIAIEVRFLSEDARTRNSRLGGRFVGLPRAERKIIEQFVASIDREWRRKMAKD